MKIESLNSYLSLTANVGVILGLIFVAIEVQQSNQNLELSNRIAIGSAEMDLVALSTDINNTIFENENMPSLFAKLSVSDSNLTEEEKQLAYYVSFRHLNRYNAAQRAFDNNLISERTFEVYLQDAELQIKRLPGMAPFLFEHLTGYEMALESPSPVLVHIFEILEDLGYSDN